MSPMKVTMRRTIGMARSFFTSAFAIGGFLAGAGALFAFNLDAAEGSVAKLSSVWAASVSPVLPVLAALLGMETWSDERKTGRIDMLLSSPVRERDIVLGKFFGVWFLAVFSVLLFLVSSFVFLRVFAPQLAVDKACLGGFLPGVFALAMQAALWSAVSVACSAMFHNAAAAATATVAILVAIPRGVWFALFSWAPGARATMGELPTDEHAFDFASGLISTGTILFYVIFTCTALFVASKIVASYRLGSRGAFTLRQSTRFAVLLAVVFASLASTLAYRLDATLDLPVGGTGATRFSPKTRAILAASSGSVTITAFVERGGARFRQLGHFLRALRREADEVGGMKIDVRFVDPNLDVGEAQRLVRADVERDSLVFEQSGRIVGRLSIAGGCSERACASLIESIAVPFARRSVCWTTGHGEASFEEYGVDGASDIARHIARNGFTNKTVDLASGTAVDDDCALIIIAGARTDFSAIELDRLHAYLDGKGGKGEGGRLLALVDSADSGSVPSLLAEWGIRPAAASFAGARTLTGTDIIASDFSPDHLVSRPFAGRQQIVLEKPVSFVASAAAADPGAGADRKRFVELVRVGDTCVAAASERGDANVDLAVRPTRIVAVGDLGFVLNGKLRTYGNANMDFFLNAVQYLSGRETMTEPGMDAERLASGMDRRDRSRFIVASSVMFPVAFFVLVAAAIARRRRRQ